VAARWECDQSLSRTPFRVGAKESSPTSSTAAPYDREVSLALSTWGVSNGLQSDSLARSLLYIEEEPHGSWRICEKDSDAIVSRHPGDRSWNDLLG
jgi:hypothetical protein